METISYYESLFQIYNAQDKLLSYRFRELKRILQYVVNDAIQVESTQFSSLFARLDYVFSKYKISSHIKHWIQDFRVKTKGDVSIALLEAEDLNDYIYIVAKFVEEISGTKVPDWFQPKQLNKQFERHALYQPKTIEKIIVGTVLDKKDDSLVVLNSTDGNQYRIPIQQEGQSLTEYQDTIELLRVGDKINLLDVKVDEELNCYPKHIVYEPDILLDISALAECFKSIGNKFGIYWQLFFINRFFAMKASVHLLKGHVANSFLDELLYVGGKHDDFNGLFLKTFKERPIDYTLVFEQNHELMDFMSEAKKHYNNLKRVIQDDFTSDEVDIDVHNAVLEPSFINEKLGLQGRLDLMEMSPNGDTKIIELKSGKLPFPSDNPKKIGEEHAAQARMYRMMIDQVYDRVDDNQIRTAICYSSANNNGENIRWVPKYLTFEKLILNTRNIIVAKELEICNADSPQTIANWFDDLSFDRLGMHLHDRMYWFREKWDNLQDALQDLSNVERDYFYAYYQFITQEMILSKIGDGRYSKGHSGLWNKEDVSENETYSYIDSLEIIENKSDASEPTLRLKRPELSSHEAYNFRVGDMVVLYQKEHDDSIPTESQIFKGTLQSEITKSGELEIAFRYKQNENVKEQVFNNNHNWCIEHDSSDNSFHLMFQNLYDFTQYDQEKRSIVLGTKEPIHYTISDKEFISRKESINQDSYIEQNTILNEALSAEDYYLIIGPPGTGKTKIILKNLVKELYTQSCNVLVLAYTRRAVDEICDSVDVAIKESDRDGSSYIRIGSALSTNKKYHNRLLDTIARESNKREDLQQAIADCSVYISTVHSILNKKEIFDFKDFDVVIIDEASQILEPHLIGLLGRFKKFILIGDHKQLPAISQQNEAQAKRFSASLEGLGIQDLRESYFERLLRVVKKNKWSHCCNILTYQGRMHVDIQEFVNNCFYNNELKIAGLPHQVGCLPYKSATESALQKYLQDRRMLFVPSKETLENNRKINEFEAKATAIIVKELIELHVQNDLPIDLFWSIGVITLYRDQIALIKKELEDSGIDGWENISVDTVERYQGSQRDFVIVSFAINSFTQLEFLKGNLTHDIETNVSIDKKLNVAITRAKKQFILLANPYYINEIDLYHKFIEFIKSKGGYVEDGVGGIIMNNLTMTIQK